MLACKLLHTLGRWGLPNNLQRMLASNSGQGMPAGLPLGRVGSAEEIEGAMQQAPHPARQFINDGTYRE